MSGANEPGPAEQATASVVIPAHDEEARIVDTLGALLQDARDGEFEVVVVCNGCSDGTAERARTFPVSVVEIPEASKIAALREGDSVAQTFPRIYLDADVRLATAGARALVAACRRPGVLAAGLRSDLDLSGASRLARWYHEFRHTLPVFRHGVIGAGVYAMSADGRSRFGVWPQVLADDQFVFRLFTPSERATVPGERTRVGIEGGIRDVIRRGVRFRRGNRELGRAPQAGGVGLPPPPAGIGEAVRAALPSPRRWPGLVTWVLVNVVIRISTRLRSRGDWSSTR